MKVVFFGTPSFAARILTDLLDHGIEVVAVVSKPDKAQGRSHALVPTPVKEAALACGIPLYQPEKVSDPAFAPTLQAYNADLFVVVAYGEILRQHILDMPRLGCINVHASLLPKYRGAAPIQRAIISGEKETGVTIMYLVRQMDAGDMIEKAVLAIDPEAAYGEVQDQLCQIGSKTLLKVLDDLRSGTAKRTPQNHNEATLAPKIELEDCEVDFSKPAQAMHDLIRGVNPEPGAWCWVSVKGERKRLKIFKSRVVEQRGEPGAILNWGKAGLTIATADKALELLEVQLEGKKRMSGKDLSLGIPETLIQFKSLQ